MKREDLIACFQDTLEKSQTGPLARLTQAAANSSRVYEEKFESYKLYKVHQTSVRVVEGTSFSVAWGNLPFGRVAVLNFANPHFPGGGVAQGAMAQEECLCRSSNLYSCLNDPKVFEGFYRYHRTQTDYDFSDRLIYTRDVTVFKDDQALPRDLEQKNWFQVDVITCAAPYLAKRRHYNRQVLKAVLKKRIRNIFEAAMENEVEVLILGAFGCGAFRNPPEVVAEAFRAVLEEDRYRCAFGRVIFAIKSTVDSHPDKACPNIAAFQQALFGFSPEKRKLRDAAAQDDPSLEDLQLPGGRVLHRGQENRTYQRWKQENRYFGKQFSILGDSISTLEGFNPKGNQVYYTGKRSDETLVRDMRDTWWGKVIDFFGGELLVNNSWSGCRVSRMDGSTSQYPSGCSDRRTRELDEMGVQPDVILVYMGTNDWGSGVPLEPVGDVSLATADSCFSMAYGLMLNKLRKRYPKADIWCCTLPQSCMESDPQFRFPEAYGGTSIREYNRHIRNAALANQCAVIDLYGSKLAYDSVDGTHPTLTGMDTLAVGVIRQMADPRGAAMLDCQGQHEAREGVCRRCGKRLDEVVDGPVGLRLKMRATGEIRTAIGTQIVVGRSRDCKLVLDNGYVARSQATFTFRSGHWTLRDNRSRNGTYLNGQRLEWDEEYRLEPGDVINFARKEEAVFLG